MHCAPTFPIMSLSSLRTPCPLRFTVLCLLPLSSVPSRHLSLDSLRTVVLSLSPKPYCGAGSVKDRKRWGVGTSPHYLPSVSIGGAKGST
jgi:hypothetical protein